MRKFTLIIIACLLFGTAFSQTLYKDITSERLNTVRHLKIKLPKDYDINSDVKHPVIIVFDADYLFEPVAGQVEFQTYFDDMPSSIIVGIMQAKDREFDGYYDLTTGLPYQSGYRFHQFISTELLPYIDNTYNTSSFRVAVGHDLMGNFINSYLYKQSSDFQAYVCLSPDFMGSLKTSIAQTLDSSNKDIFYYLATSDKDIPSIRENILIADAEIKELSNTKLTYYFDDFKGESHYTLVSGAIARSFNKIFELYNPIREKELNEKVLPFEGTLDDYLIQRYKNIDKLFGVTKKINEKEIEKVAEIAEGREDFKSLEKLGHLANKLYPKSLLGTYYIAQSAEKLGKTKRAKKLYQAALDLEDATSTTIDKDYITAKIDELTVVLVGTDDTEELEEELVDAEDHE